MQILVFGAYALWSACAFTSPVLHTSTSNRLGVLRRLETCGRPRSVLAMSSSWPIYDKESPSVAITSPGISELGNEDVVNYSFYMKVIQTGFFHLSKMTPGAVIKSHSHAGDILNLIQKGAMSFTSAGVTKTYSQGDWLMVPKGVEYAAVADEEGGVEILMFCTFVDEDAHIMAWVVPE